MMFKIFKALTEMPVKGMPISIGGTTFTPQNIQQQLYNLANNNLVIRTMREDEWTKSEKRCGSALGAPLGLVSNQNAIVLNTDGSLNTNATHSRYLAHHQGNVMVHSFSHGYTIYSLLGIASKKNLLQLLDMTGVKSPFRHLPGSSLNGPSFDADGTPNVYTFEKEISIQHPSSICCPGQLQRVDNQLIFTGNPLFIDLQDPDLPPEILKTTELAISLYQLAALNASDLTLSEKGIIPNVSFDQARMLTIAAVVNYRKYYLDIHDMKEEQRKTVQETIKMGQQTVKPKIDSSLIEVIDRISEKEEPQSTLNP